MSFPMAVQATAISLSHHEPLERLSIRAASTDGMQKVGAAGPVDMRFDALGRTFELQLSPNGALLDAARELTGGAALAYRGQLAGAENSWARIVIADGVPAGVIWDGREMFAIERPVDNLAGAGTTIIYRLADAIVAPGSMTCGAGDSETTGSAFYKSLGVELSAVSAQATSADSFINIGIVADAEFYARYGDDSGLQIFDRMSLVDGYFSEQVGIQFRWPFVQIFKDSAAGTYPFDQGTEPSTLRAGDLLDELADYRNSQPNQHVNGLTHLWTGKNVEGDNGSTSTVGIAYTSELCDQKFGVGLSEGLDGPVFDSLVAAHEIGHNFGAPHDGTPPGSACESVDTSVEHYLMEPSLNGSTKFSQCSLEQMADDIEQAKTGPNACITPLPSVDVGIGVADPAPSVLLGNTSTVTFDIVNDGTLPATDVQADFSLPGNVSLISAAASLGNCTDGGGMVSCAIGDIEGLSTLTVILTSDTIAVGSGTFDASVTTAADDDDLSNNQSSLTLTVQPAVDLTVTPPSTQQLDVDQSTGLTAVLGNSSVLDASGVGLSISLSPGLRADSASWPLGACTVSGSQVDCEAATFAALSNVTLSLGVTATTEGAKTIEFSMSSAEAEADPANNSARATINVGAEEENGGGGTDLWLLSLLGLLSIRRRAIPV